MANGYHLFSTGEVLTAANVNDYLMKQTVMIFASASARTTALSGVLREGMLSYRLDAHVLESYTGSAWVTAGSSVTTKGDLQTFDTAPTRLAVGSDGQTLVANSANASGLGWTSGNPIPNPVLNSAMQVWQRGTSVAIAGSAGGYVSDRWYVQSVPTGSAVTVTRQATNDTTNLPFIQYCSRVQRNSGQTATGNIIFSQSMETINSIPFAGKTVTMSFYARAGANYSGASNALAVNLISGTGTDQNRGIGTPYTGEAFPINSQSATLTTTLQRFAFTGTVGATATELAFYTFYTPSGTAGANDYFEITGCQIDIGSVALPFRTNGTTLQGELTACQRYYVRSKTGNAAGRLFMNSGSFTTSTNAFIVVGLPVEMRVPPTSIDFGGNLGLYDFSSDLQVTNLALTGTAGGNLAQLVTVTVASGGTQYRPAQLESRGDAAAYVGFSAEL